MKKIFLFPYILVIVFFVVVAFMSLSEFWNVAILNDTNKYAWSANEDLWRYKTSTIYWSVMLVGGITMLFLSIMAIKELINSKVKTPYWFISCFAFCLIMFLL